VCSECWLGHLLCCRLQICTVKFQSYQMLFTMHQYFFINLYVPSTAADIVWVTHIYELIINVSDFSDFVVSVANYTGIILDPTYTGKAAYGLTKELANNLDMFKGRIILFLHTGTVLFIGCVNWFRVCLYSYMYVSKFLLNILNFSKAIKVVLKFKTRSACTLADPGGGCTRRAPPLRPRTYDFFYARNANCSQFFFARD